MGKRPGQKWAQGKLLGRMRKGKHTVTSVLTRWSLAQNYQAPETTRSRKWSKWYMKYLFRKQHGERKTQRVKLDCLPLPIAELKSKNSSEACRTGEVLLINPLKKTVRSLRVGSGQGSDQSLGVGTSRGQGEEWPAALPPKASGFQASGHQGQRPFPLCQPSCSQGLCAPALWSNSGIIKVSGLALGPLGVPSERDYAWPF